MESTSDTPGERAAREALRESVEKNRTEVALAGETIALLRSEMRVAVASGVSDGLALAMTDENAERFFGGMVKAMQKQATVRTGRWVLGGIGAMASRAFWVAVLFVVLYNLGGWMAVKAAWKVFQGGTP